MVDLEDGQFLFALLKGDYSGYFMGIVAPAAFSQQKESLKRIVRRPRALNMELLGEVEGKRGRASSVIDLPEHL